MRDALRAGLAVRLPAVGAGGPDLEALARVVVEAEAAGFDTVWFAGSPGGPALRPPESDAPGPAAVEPDPFVTAATLAPAAGRVGLGVWAYVGEGHRAPSVLARELTSLDHVTGGRAALLVEPDPVAGTTGAEGFMEDVSTVLSEMLRRGTATYRGSTLEVEAAVNHPPPLQAGGPPLLTPFTPFASAPPVDAVWVRGDVGSVAQAKAALAPPGSPASPGPPVTPGAAGPPDPATGTPGRLGLVWVGHLPADRRQAGETAAALRGAGADGVLCTSPGPGLPTAEQVRAWGAALAPPPTPPAPAGRPGGTP